jgi:ABC-type sugar transport system substrate-binding protein
MFIMEGDHVLRPSRAAARLAFVLALLSSVAVVVAATAGGASQKQVAAPPKITVGFLQILGASPAAQRIEAQFRKAATSLGWTVNVVDAQGDPAKMASGIQSFVTQKVDAIVAIAVAPAAAQQALTAAKKAKIPAIVIGSPNPDPNKLYAAQISPNDSALGAILAQYMCDDLGKGAKIVAQYFPPLEALQRRDVVAQALFKFCGIKVVATHQVDFANAVQDATKSTLDMLRANPDATGVFADQDFEFAAAVNAVKQLGRQNKVKVYGFLAGAETLSVLRKGKPAAALADAAYNNVSWLAADQLLQFFGKKKPIDPNAQYNIVPIPTALITSANVPKTGDEYPHPDPAPTFKARWKALGFDVK